MKKCPFCGADIEESARFCLYCMSSLIEKEQILVHKKKKPQGLLILAAIVGAAIILLLLLFGRRDVQNTKGQTTDTTVTTATTETTTVPTTSPTTSPTTASTAEPTVAETEPTQAATQPTTKPGRPANKPTTPPAEPTTQPTESETDATEPHSHSFHLKYTTEEFLQSEATCECPAIYYYSCTCGQKGEDIFLSGSAKGHTLITLEGYPPADCVTAGKTDGTYCTVCQQVIQKQNTIQASGHVYAFSASVTPCLTCGEMGTLTIQPPALPHNHHDIYMVNSGYFRVVKLSDTCYNVIMCFNYTNISSKPTDGYPFAGPGTMHGGTHLEPGESGIYESVFQVSSPYGTYQVDFG